MVSGETCRGDKPWVQSHGEYPLTLLFNGESWNCAMYEDVKFDVAHANTGVSDERRLVRTGSHHFCLQESRPVRMTEHVAQERAQAPCFAPASLHG